MPGKDGKWVSKKRDEKEANDAQRLQVELFRNVRNTVHASEGEKTEGENGTHLSLGCFLRRMQW